MKIVVDKNEFSKNLSIGSVFAGKLKTLPILQCVKIELLDGKATITSSNLENTIVKEFNVSGSDCENFSLCLNSIDLAKIIKSLPKGEFTISYDESSSMAEIIHMKGSMKIPAYPSTSFPIINVGNDESFIDIDASMLCDWVCKSMKFTANDELRPVLNGMYMFAQDGVVGYCATNAIVLITDNINDGQEHKNFSFVINKSSLSAISKMASSNVIVTVGVNSKNVTFSTLDGTNLYSTLIEGTYPNFSAVIPNNNDIEALVDKESMKDAINRAMNCMNKATCVIKIEVSEDKMKIEATDVDLGKNSVEYVECKASQPVFVGVNAVLFLDCIESIESNTIKMCMKDEKAPVVIKDSMKEDKTVLIMPTMIS